MGEPDGTGGRPGTINERASSFTGVSIGGEQETIQPALGTRGPASLNEPIIPANQDIEDYRGPVSFRGSDEVYRYDGVSVFVTDGAVEGFMVTSRGSHTTRGLAIGDPLDDARRAYPDLGCGTAHTEGGGYPACAGQLPSGRWIWLGGDPVSNITLSSARLEGVTGAGPPARGAFGLTSRDGFRALVADTNGRVTGDLGVSSPAGPRTAGRSRDFGHGLARVSGALAVWANVDRDTGGQQRRLGGVLAGRPSPRLARKRQAA